MISQRQIIYISVSAVVVGLVSNFLFFSLDPDIRAAGRFSGDSGDVVKEGEIPKGAWQSSTEIQKIKRLFRNSGDSSLSNTPNEDLSTSELSEEAAEAWLMLGTIKGDNIVKGYIMGPEGTVKVVEHGDLFGKSFKVLEIYDKEILYIDGNGKEGLMSLYRRLGTD